MAKAAKMSRVDKLHALFFDTLITALEAGDPPASVLSVVRSALADAGAKPVNDSPQMTRMMNAYDALPFTDADDAPTTSKKAN